MTKCDEDSPETTFIINVSYDRVTKALKMALKRICPNSSIEEKE